ncbi:hypothetical protein ID866_13007 [Astraeus odoratus]|nr:hypothetical protein ID866_13007 [Astraeus odoratus]
MVHRVKTVQLKRVDGRSENLGYEIQATGLHTFEVPFHEQLNNALARKLPLVVIRPWYGKLLDRAVEVDDAATQRWISLLDQPFRALLLTEVLHNEYKRIASSSSIVTHPKDTASILSSEVSTLTIV